MSNQNFDNHGTFSSSSQPIPIARQLGSQAYLSQIQDKKDAISDDVTEPVQRTPRQPTPAPAVSVRENKMDAFFRQAEEEEKLQQTSAQNAASSQTDARSSAAEQQPDVAAVVELPVVADLAGAQMVEAVPPIQPVPRAGNSEPQTQSNIGLTPAAPPATRTIVLDTATPQADVTSESTGDQAVPPDFFSTTFGGMSGFNPAAPADQHWAGQNLVVPSAPAHTPNHVPASTSASVTPPPQNESNSAPVNQEPSVTSEARRLTGAAGLSAAMAAAGMGTLGVAVAEGKSIQQIKNDHARQHNTGSAAQPYQPIGQSNNGQHVVPENGGLPVVESVQQQPSPPVVEQPSIDDTISEAGSQANRSAANWSLESATVEDPAVGAAPAFDPAERFPSESGADQSTFPNNGPVVNATPPVVANDFQTNPSGQQTPAMAQSTPPQNATDAAVNGAVHFADESPAVNSESDLDAVADIDAKMEAMRQAEKIKAEHARYLAQQTPSAARPYGASGDDPTSTSVDSSSLSTADQLTPTQPVSGPVVGSQTGPTNVNSANVVAQHDNPDSVVSMQVANTLASSVIVENVATDAANQRRPFPMALFNQQLLMNLRSGVIFVDHQRRVQMWSKSTELMTGIVSEAVIDRPLYPQTINLRFEDGTGVALDQCPVTKTLETNQVVKSDYRILNASNQEMKIEVTVVPVIDKNRYVNGAIVLLDDHSAEIDLQRQLKDLYEFSVLDPLTQVANRAEFERVLEEYVRAFNASDHFNCSIIICDIDYFKSINDNFGHTVGDQALVAFADMLKKYVRSQDLVARYGGEEFVILCADCDTDSALQRAEQIRMALFKTQQSMLDGKAISASFGVSELRQGDTAMEFFVRADTALLKAKELGRNRVVIADQREAAREVGVGSDASVSGVKWRQQRREHTALLCEEFKTSTPVSVLVEKLRGFIIEKDAWLQRVDQEFLSMEVDFEDPRDYSRKGSFTMNIEFKEGEDDANVKSSRKTFIRITVFPGRRKKWFSTNHTDVAPHLLSDLRSYLMINDEASHLSVKMATENVRG